MIFPQACEQFVEVLREVGPAAAFVFVVEGDSGEDMWELFSSSAPPVKVLADCAIAVAVQWEGPSCTPLASTLRPAGTVAVTSVLVITFGVIEDVRPDDLRMTLAVFERLGIVTKLRGRDLVVPGEQPLGAAQVVHDRELALLARQLLLERSRAEVGKRRSAEPEDEAGTVFLRLRKAARGRKLPIYSIAPFTSRGLHKMSGTLIPTRPGDEAAAIRALAHDGSVALDSGGVILVGERLAELRVRHPEALSSAAIARNVRRGSRRCRIFAITACSCGSCSRWQPSAASR